MNEHKDDMSEWGEMRMLSHTKEDGNRRVLTVGTHCPINCENEYIATTVMQLWNMAREHDGPDEVARKLAVYSELLAMYKNKDPGVYDALRGEVERLEKPTPKPTVGDLKPGDEYILDNEEFIRVIVPGRGSYGLSKTDWVVHLHNDSTPCEIVK